MKRLILYVTAIFIVLNCVIINASCEENNKDNPFCKAKILVECSTGQVLSEKNSHEKLPMASVTKLMCMLIWAEKLESGKLSFEDVVTCSSNSSSKDGSVIWIEPGEKLTVKELIKSVVIASANDACTALCEHIAGTEAEFVKLMNNRAKELGMEQTSYKNCVGYDEEGHYTTAYDISLLCQEIIKFDYYNEFYNTRLDYVREGERAAQLLNTNKLLGKYDGLIGGKTGTTDNAGCCLTVWAKRGKMTLCAVELGAKEDSERFELCSSMLDYGFNNFELYKAKADSDILTQIPVNGAVEKSVDIRIKQLPIVVIPKGSSSKIRYNYSKDEILYAPIKCGERIGTMNAVLNDEEIFKSELVSVKEIEKLDFFKSLIIIFKAIFNL